MPKMTLEIPEFKRCCFCLPLRAGLLTWGYFKIIADVLMTPVAAYVALYYLMIGYLGEFESLAYGIFSLITLTAVIANFVATFIFIIGGHKKNVKRIRGFYIYSIWELRVMTLLIVVAVGVTIKYWRADALKTQLVVFTIYLLILALHAYFILLLKSEVIKLENDGGDKIGFVNNLAEVECIISSKEKEAAIVNGLPNEAH